MLRIEQSTFCRKFNQSERKWSSFLTCTVATTSTIYRKTADVHYQKRGRHDVTKNTKERQHRAVVTDLPPTNNNSRLLEIEYITKRAKINTINSVWVPRAYRGITAKHKNQFHHRPKEYRKSRSSNSNSMIPTTNETIKSKRTEQSNNNNSNNTNTPYIYRDLIVKSHNALLEDSLKYRRLLTSDSKNNSIVTSTPTFSNFQRKLTFSDVMNSITHVMKDIHKIDNAMTWQQIQDTEELFRSICKTLQEVMLLSLLGQANKKLNEKVATTAETAVLCYIELWKDRKILVESSRQWSSQQLQSSASKTSSSSSSSISGLGWIQRIFSGITKTTTTTTTEEKKVVYSAKDDKNVTAHEDPQTHLSREVLEGVMKVLESLTLFSGEQQVENNNNKNKNSNTEKNFVDTKILIHKVANRMVNVLDSHPSDWIVDYKSQAIVLRTMSRVGSIDSARKCNEIYQRYTYNHQRLSLSFVLDGYVHASIYETNEQILLEIINEAIRLLYETIDENEKRIYCGSIVLHCIVHVLKKVDTVVPGIVEKSELVAQRCLGIKAFWMLHHQVWSETPQIQTSIIPIVNYLAQIYVLSNQHQHHLHPNHPDNNNNNARNYYVIGKRLIQLLYETSTTAKNAGRHQQQQRQKNNDNNEEHHSSSTGILQLVGDEAATTSPSPHEYPNLDTFHTTFMAIERMHTYNKENDEEKTTTTNNVVRNDNNNGDESSGGGVNNKMNDIEEELDYCINLVRAMLSDPLAICWPNNDTFAWLLRIVQLQKQQEQQQQQHHVVKVQRLEEILVLMEHAQLYEPTTITIPLDMYHEVLRAMIQSISSMNTSTTTNTTGNEQQQQDDDDEMTSTIDHNNSNKYEMVTEYCERAMLLVNGLEIRSRPSLFHPEYISTIPHLSNLYNISICPNNDTYYLLFRLLTDASITVSSLVDDENVQEAFVDIIYAKYYSTYWKSKKNLATTDAGNDNNKKVHIILSQWLSKIQYESETIENLKQLLLLQEAEAEEEEESIRKQISQQQQQQQQQELATTGSNKKTTTTRNNKNEGVVMMV